MSFKPRLISKRITYCGQTIVVACDGKCVKAWGSNSRAKVSLSVNEDDFAYLADDELGEAPADPGTYEGQDGKPVRESEELNKWCIRECERSARAPSLLEIRLPDFSQRVYNIPQTDDGPMGL